MQPPGDTEDQAGAPVPLGDALGELPPQHFSAPDESDDLFLAKSGGTSTAKSPSLLTQHAQQQQQEAGAPTPISQRCPTPGIEGSPQGPDMQQLGQEQLDEDQDQVLQMPQHQEQPAPAAAGTERRGAGTAAHARGQQGEAKAARELLYSHGQGGEPMQHDQAAAKPDTSKPAWRTVKRRGSTKASKEPASRAEPKHAAGDNAGHGQDKAPAAADVAGKGRTAAAKAAAKPQSARAPPMQTFAGRKTPQKVQPPSVDKFAD